jgi:cytochrome c-type biogenesis protein CcmH
MAGELRNAVAEARQRAGLPALAAAPAATAQAAAPAATSLAPVAGASIQGRVTLAAKLKAQAAPEDTVFIFARALQGGRAPLAILRKQVKDLPLDFTLDDSLAMSPAMRLSTAKEVIIGARISKSGTATPQPGDMQGLTGAIAVGSKGIALEINEPIR